MNELEKRVLEMLLTGEAHLLHLHRAQVGSATVAHREFTGVGFFTHLSIPASGR